jgi:chromosome segregation ATPase
MDTIFIWIVAVASLGLLGTFLIASERELKNKRRELDELKSKLTASVLESSGDAAAGDPHESESTAELLATNQELAQQLSDLKAKMAASEGHDEELQALRGHLNAMGLENDELRSHGERLETELAALQSQLESKAARHNEPSDPAGMERIVADLEEQLQGSWAKVRDLENIRERLESQQTALEESRRQQEADAIRLENELAAEKENGKLLEATQLRLSRVEQRHQQLSETHSKLRHENSELRERYENLWRELSQRVEQLRLEQAAIVDKNRSAQEEILALSNWLESVPETALSPQAEQATKYDLNGSLDPAAEQPSDGFDSANEMSMVEEESSNQARAVGAARQAGNSSASSAPANKKRRFGIFSAG